jgi:ribosomal protein S18 acetylase RimI-like enzyme
MSPSPFRLTPDDTARYVRLRLRMLQAAPWAFSASPEDDLALDPAHVATLLADEHHAIFAVSAEDGALVAAASIVRQQSPKYAHRAKLWGVFVEPAHRGSGLGRAVISAAIDLARGWQEVDYIDLGVSANSPDAQHLYESLGFRVWGREPESLQHKGRRYDEIFMTLRL